MENLISGQNIKCEKLPALQELHEKLDEALAAMKAGGGRSAKVVFDDIKKEFEFCER